MDQTYDNQMYGSLANSGGGAFQSLAAFFSIINLKSNVLWHRNPGAASALETISAPLKGTTGFLKLEDGLPNGAVAQTFRISDAPQGEYSKGNVHNISDDNNFVIDTPVTTLLLFMGEQKGRRPRAGNLKGVVAHTPYNESKGVIAMLPPILGAFQPAQKEINVFYLEPRKAARPDRQFQGWRQEIEISGLSLVELIGTCLTFIGLVWFGVVLMVVAR